MRSECICQLHTFSLGRRLTRNADCLHRVAEAAQEAARDYDLGVREGAHRQHNHLLERLLHVLRALARVSSCGQKIEIDYGEEGLHQEL